MLKRRMPSNKICHHVSKDIDLIRTSRQTSPSMFEYTLNLASIQPSVDKYLCSKALFISHLPPRHLIHDTSILGVDVELLITCRVVSLKHLCPFVVRSEEAEASHFDLRVVRVHESIPWLCSIHRPGTTAVCH